MSTIKNVSSETQNQASIIAKGTQKKGQTKAQTKVIAAGIEKGIAQYKKQQKVKMRERDKLRKKRDKANTFPQQESTSILPKPDKVNKLPWFLLLVSWSVFLGYFFTR
ncbi:MAG: DUF2956 domain-containing protein [Litorilituus sp.]|jgi:hypothetical protein|nr:DUF2956 domain-containing protein [Litorilituus sp.]